MEKTVTLDEIYQPVKGDLSRVEVMVREVSRAKLGWLPRELAQGLREGGRVSELLTHILTSEGKRLRPALTLLSAKLYDYQPEKVLPMATAIEVLHIATLVHDDAIDNSSLRRGRPTINSIWGDEKAILLGDYLVAQSGELAGATGNRTVVKRLYQTLMTIASGELAQAFSAFNLEKSERYYLNRISSKTASLLALSTECGGILSQAPRGAVKALKDYGFNIGIAFQIVDDILDYIGTTAEMGKPVGSDLREGTITLPVLLLVKNQPDAKDLLDDIIRNRNREANTKKVSELIRSSDRVIGECYDMAANYRGEAKESLKRLPDKPARKSLFDLADFMVQRRR
ncbi:MAG: polyprenyl synthetase family protein [Chloroflexota bacterium]